MKKAVVYDKWLSSLGGGEVVACHIARILRDEGYDVTVVGGKQFNTAAIKKKLDIDLSGVQFAWAWNDEQYLRSLSKDADVFFNTTFMDYSHGTGKKSYFYTHFPSPAIMSAKGMLFNYILVPLFSRWVDRIEFVTDKNEIIINNRYGYLLQRDNHILFTNEHQSSRVVSFSLFYENHYDKLLRETEILFDNAKVLKRTIWVDPHHNIVHFRFHIDAHSDTIGLHISYPPLGESHSYPKDRIVLLFPKTLPGRILDVFMKKIIVKFETRMRAGIYVNVFKRIDSYTGIISNSEFTKRWVRNYWDRPSEVIYPPVSLIPLKKNMQKKNMICSIGRFFTLGHGKKQEIMIKAFKRLCDSGLADWELHLIGGVDVNGTDSAEFVQKLKRDARGYPVHFHLNANREKVEEIARQSKIYWHATGYDESEERDPVKFEHFGIAPIEAISAGCIPILYKGGGLPEIIRTLRLSNLHLYTTIDELVEKTLHIAHGTYDYNYELVAQRLEAHFSADAFARRIRQLL